jgi:hypothetical protein
MFCSQHRTVKADTPHANELTPNLRQPLTMWGSFVCRESPVVNLPQPARTAYLLQQDRCNRYAGHGF